MKQPIYQTRHGIGQGGALPGLPGFALTRHRPHTHTSRVAAGDNSSVQPRGTAVAVALTASTRVRAHVYQALASASFLLEIRLCKVSHQRSPVNHICFRHSKFSLLVPFHLSERKSNRDIRLSKILLNQTVDPRDLPSTFPRRLGLPSAPFASAEEGRLFRNQKK